MIQGRVSKHQIVLVAMLREGSASISFTGVPPFSRLGQSCGILTAQQYEKLFAEKKHFRTGCEESPFRWTAGCSCPQRTVGRKMGWKRKQGRPASPLPVAEDGCNPWSDGLDFVIGKATRMERGCLSGKRKPSFEDLEKVWA